MPSGAVKRRQKKLFFSNSPAMTCGRASRLSVPYIDETDKADRQYVNSKTFSESAFESSFVAMLKL